MSFPGWLSEINGVPRVERQEGRRPGGQAYLKLVDGTRRVIWHTTEGSSVDGAVSTLRANFSCPHFVVGPGRVVQMRPLWAEAATVRGDNSRAWQVEVVGFSKQAPWMHDDATRRVVVALLSYFRDRLNVPLARPDGWRDDCADIDGIWASEGNSRRRSGRAPSFAGHVMHLDWPDNTHWDQGAVRWTPLLDEARGEDDDVGTKEMRQGGGLFRADKPLPSDASPDMEYGYNLEKRIAAARELPVSDGTGHCAADCTCRAAHATLVERYGVHRHDEGRTGPPVDA